jgi:hypothetical protein
MKIYVLINQNLKKKIPTREETIPFNPCLEDRDKNKSQKYFDLQF